MNKPDKETLQRLHHADSLRPSQIGKIFGVQAQTVRKWIHAYGIDHVVRQPKQPPPNKLPIPPGNVLRRLYESDRLTTSQIGERFNVTSTTANKWLKHYRVKLRPAGTGLNARGIAGPTKDELHKMIHVDFLSYSEVANIYSVDQSAVLHWLDKYDIPRPKSWVERHSDPETIRNMMSMYKSGMSLTEIGQCFMGISRPMVAKLFRQHGIDIREDGFRGGRRFLCNDNHQVRSTYELRVDNWLNQQGIKHDYEPPIPGEPYMKADFLANGWYIEIWGVNGNKEYDEKKRTKQLLYSSLVLPLIEIPCHSFALARNSLWIRKLRAVLQPPI